MDKKYDDFIKQVNLLDIHLKSVDYKKLGNSSPDEYPQIEINYKPKKASFCQKDTCLEVIQEVLFSLTECDSDKHAGSHKLFELKATFAIVYSSAIALDDELFELFKKRNVPVNIHPYARELIQNAMTRVGLPPFTLPILRIKK